MTLINMVRLISSKDQASGQAYSQPRPVTVNVIPSLGLCVSQSVKWASRSVS